MSERSKDFLERLAFTVAFVVVGLAIPYLTGINESWAIPIVAGLQIIKNLLAQQVGDPKPAPFLGEHSEQVLAERLGLSSGAIATLIDRGVVATSDKDSK